MTSLAPLLQTFFTQRLTAQQNASPHTIAAYRDTFRLLLTFAQEHTGIPPARLSLEDLNAGLISAYLDHLESQRGVSITTRNCRLAALHSLFRFTALRHPEHAALIQRVLASRPNALAARSSPTSPPKRSTPCSPHPTSAPGVDDETEHCCSWPSKPDCESPSSPACVEQTSYSAPGHTSPAPAKAENNAPRRSPPTPPRSCAPG